MDGWMDGLGFIIIIMTGVCTAFLLLFFFPRKRKEKKRKGKKRITVAAPSLFLILVLVQPPSHQFSISAVGGFPSPKKMTWIVMSSLFVSQSVSSVLSLTTCCISAKKAIRQKKTKKLTSLASKTAAAPSSPPVIDPRPRPPTRSSLDASLRSRLPRQRIPGWRGAGRCSSGPLPVSGLAVHRSGPERSASPWTVGAGVLVPGRAFRASGRRARRLGRW